MRIIVGLSGGVDSAVAALLLKRAGHEVIGVTMAIWREGRYRGGERDACFGPGEAADIAVAKEFASSIGIDYHIFDCSAEYESSVLEYFRNERMSGRTPNPCVVCNRRMKFGLLPKKAAEKISYDYFATGHYARLTRLGNRVAIARATDTAKDQSYFLWDLSQEQIAHAMFPLGTLSKAEVRRIAQEADLPMAAKPDSQDFYSGNVDELVGLEDLDGDIVSLDGKVLGRHHGHWHYTVGQRQGLGLGGGTPYYVIRIDPCHNVIVVGTRDETICCEFLIKDINWQAIEPVNGGITGFAKVRSCGQPSVPVTIRCKDGIFDSAVVYAENGLFGVTPGQSAVIYSSDGAILCGGIITQ